LKRVSVDTVKIGHAQVVDVGPRDGLQNEEKILSPEIRAGLCDRLAAAGVPKIDAASFVNPRRVPQMAGAEEVMAAVDGRPGTSYAGLVLNEKGYETGIDLTTLIEVAVWMAQQLGKELPGQVYKAGTFAPVAG
jgi:isopropylmalate/homocitrate/citramalate synthase